MSIAHGYTVVTNFRKISAKEERNASRAVLLLYHSQDYDKHVSLYGEQSLELMTAGRPTPVENSRPCFIVSAVGINALYLVLL